MPQRPPTHRPIKLTPRKSATHDIRIRGRALQSRRERWLRMHPLCVMCEREGRTTAADEVDHIVALRDGGIEHESNLQSLCLAHHSAKSAREQANRRRVMREGVYP